MGEALSPSHRHIAEVLGVYFIVSVATLACGLIPGPDIDHTIRWFMYPLSVVPLIPLYLWYRRYREHTVLSHQIGDRGKQATVFWVVALFVLAMAVRFPSVLLSGMVYEKIALTFLVILTIVFIEGKALSTFGFKTAKKGVLLGLFYGFMLHLIWFGGVDILGYALTQEVPCVGWDPSRPLGWLPYEALVVGLSEEGLFRGYIQTHVARFYGRWRTILLQAVLFGLWHIVYYFSPLDLTGMLFRVASTFAGGLLFGYLYGISESLAPVILMHGLRNSVSTDLVLNNAFLSKIIVLPDRGLTTYRLIFVVPEIVAAIAVILLAKFLTIRAQRLTRGCRPEVPVPQGVVGSNHGFVKGDEVCTYSLG